MIPSNSSITLAVLACIAFSASRCAQAEPIELARTTVEIRGPGPHGTTSIVPGTHHQAYFELEANTSFGSEYEAPSAFWPVQPLTSADVGSTFTLAQSDSRFPALAARLTDGDAGNGGLGEDVLFFSLGVPGVAGGGTGIWEHYVFHDNSIFSGAPDEIHLQTQLFVPLPTTIDLHGAMLTSIEMRIDSVGIFHVDNSTALRGGFTLSFFGIPPEIVPEPSLPAALALLAALTPLARRRILSP